MTRSVYQFNVRSQSGAVISNAEVNVYNAGTTTPKNVYSSPNSGAPLSQPIIADVLGYVQFYAEPTICDIKATDTVTLNSSVWQNVEIGTARKEIEDDNVTKEIINPGDNVSLLLNDAGYAELSEQNNFLQQPSWVTLPLATEQYVDLKSDAVSGVWDWVEATTGDPLTGNFGGDALLIENISLLRVNKTTASGEAISGANITTDDKLFVVAQDRIHAGVYTVVTSPVDQGDWVEIPVIFEDGRGGDPDTGDRFWVAWVPQGVVEHFHRSDQIIFNPFNSSIPDDIENDQAAIDYLAGVTDTNASGLDALSSLATKPPIVDLPFKPENLINRLSGALSVTRNSTATIVNNSGVVETVGVDEPAIGRDGVGVYKAVTNLQPDSNDLRTDAGSPTVVPNAGIAPDGSNTALEVISTTGGTVTTLAVFPSVSINVSAGDKISHYVYVKQGVALESTSVTVNVITAGEPELNAIFNFSTGSESGDPFTYEKLADGWYRLKIAREYTTTATSTRIRVWPCGRNLSRAIGDSTFVWHAQINEGEADAPHIFTTGTPVTRPADNLSIPMSGNMPAAGESFTVVFDVAGMPQVGGPSYVLYSTNPLFSILLDQTNLLIISDDSGFQVIVPSNTDAPHRFVVRYESETTTFSGAVDGVVEDASAKVITSVYNTNEQVYIGSTNLQSQHLNGLLANLKIYDYALSDAQIAALGGPEDA